MSSCLPTCVLLLFLLLLFQLPRQSQAHWCEDWERNILVCQYCSEFSGHLSISNHIFTFVNDEKHDIYPDTISWNPMMRPDPYLIEDVLYLVFDEQSSQPCPNFIERFDFDFCPGEGNFDCPDSNHVWVYQTDILLFVASGTLEEWHSMTIWNASNRVWLETLLLFEPSEPGLCAGVPIIHPFLGEPTEAYEPCNAPEPESDPIPEAQPPTSEPPPNLAPAASPTPITPSTTPNLQPGGTPSSNCDTCNPTAPTAAPVAKGSETLEPSGRGFSTTGLVLGLVFGAVAVIAIITGLVLYFRRGDRAQFAPGPVQPHQFQNNPLYVRNAVEHENPLYRGN